MLYRFSTDANGNPIKQATIYTQQESHINLRDVDPYAIKIVQTLVNQGFESYIVGGAVRDLLFGKTPNDFDISTKATPNNIRHIFRNSRVIGRRFRLVHIFYGDKIFDVTTFRSTKTGSIGNVFGTIEEDVMRRDFSLNALYYDPLKQQVIDYVGGFEDIKHRIIKPVIPLDRIFDEDPVRIIRAVKFSANDNCTIPTALKAKIKKCASQISDASHSRLTDEMAKITSREGVYKVYTTALELNVWSALQPKATAMIKEDKAFAQSYNQSMIQLDELVSSKKNARIGEKLMYFIYDFIASTLQKKSKEPLAHSQLMELIIQTYDSCREFLRPIKPPKIELEYAVRLSLKRLGYNIKILKNI